jgi:hypothetical protein
MAVRSSSTPPSHSTPIPARTTTSRSWSCPRSSKRLRSCTMAPWTTSFRAFRRWIDANGCSSAAYNRELYLEYHKSRGARVTELQEPITTS